jgi:uncharacterized membrane protein
VIQKPVLARASPLQVTWLGCAAGALVCLPFAPTLVRDLDGAPPSAVAWTVYLGVAPTAVGFATWGYALRRMTAGRLASLAYLIPVVAILLGWALLGETPPGLAVVGGGLCLVGVALARRSWPTGRCPGRSIASASRSGGQRWRPLAQPSSRAVRRRTGARRRWLGARHDERPRPAASPPTPTSRSSPPRRAARDRLLPRARSAEGTCGSSSSRTFQFRQEHRPTGQALRRRLSGRTSTPSRR